MKIYRFLLPMFLLGLGAGCTANRGPAAATAKSSSTVVNVQKMPEIIPPGYENTPMLPSGYRVHDHKRPLPPVVTHASAVATPPPSDAIVLFDGKNLDQWTGEKGQPAGWKVAKGYMEVNQTGDISTKEVFGSCQLHMEWASPVKVVAESQGRGNSGIFLMNKYEIQVLDSFGNTTYSDGQAAAIYGQTPPLVNVSLPPGVWQSYDIIFHRPIFKDGKVFRTARITLLHNGVLVQDNTEILGTTMHKKLAQYEPHADKLPISLQDHHNPVRYRNIWIREIED